MFGDAARAERAALTATLVGLIGAGAWGSRFRSCRSR